MERLVDYDKFIKDYGVLSNHEDDYRLLCAANITAYTKDEVIAMLKDIKKEFDVLPINPYTSDKYECKVIIQQKIDELKEQIDEIKDNNSEK